MACGVHEGDQWGEGWVVDMIAGGGIGKIEQRGGDSPQKLNIKRRRLNTGAGCE